ncbi:methyltransferase domain-containing protein [Helicobacter cholecystus]|uniref:Methyltransferase domain-containing protein n=1 Tax=Helicobacter cholecystus TaxID=45498 RepID=A0A3D8IYA4_9HELI|nr:methyltransferase [Helicobacter cholecystus]RDU69950.1 methyltransferase domain-containing protein [Helicobacter cholecystus]VEJ24884.1 putative SAM-dependent methyltransferase [Helicobacter cholecystus]
MASGIVRLYQLSDGYCYNSDSLFLYDFSKSFLKAKQSLLDVGCGSGILGKLAKRDFDVELTMIEKDKYMAFLSQKNVLDSEVICGDFLNYQSEKRFDVLLCNPPFYRCEIIPAKNKRLNWARNESFMPLKKFFHKSKCILKPNGILLFCYDAKEAHRVFFELRSAGFNAEVARFVHPRAEKEATLVMIKAKIQSKSSLKILPPLFTHIGKEQMQNSPEVKRIYSECSTYSLKVHSSYIDLE